MIKVDDRAGGRYGKRCVERRRNASRGTDCHVGYSCVGPPCNDRSGGEGTGSGALCDNESNMSLRGIPVSAGMSWQSGSPGGEDTLKGKAMSPLLAAGYCPKSQGRFSVSLIQRTPMPQVAQTEG